MKTPKRAKDRHQPFICPLCEQTIKRPHNHLKTTHKLDKEELAATLKLGRLQYIKHQRQMALPYVCKRAMCRPTEQTGENNLHESDCESPFTKRQNITDLAELPKQQVTQQQRLKSKRMQTQSMLKEKYLDVFHDMRGFKPMETYLSQLTGKSPAMATQYTKTISKFLSYANPAHIDWEMIFDVGKITSWIEDLRTASTIQAATLLVYIEALTLAHSFVAKKKKVPTPSNTAKLNEVELQLKVVKKELRREKMLRHTALKQPMNNLMKNILQVHILFQNSE
jgi:hypothetical protein